MKLTEKQKRFVDHYIETGNATEAARLAGYKAKTDASMRAVGAENLTKLNVIINEKLAAKEDARIAKQDEVLQYLTAVMRGEETEEVIVVEGHGDGCSSARRVDKDVGAKDRLKAAELLAKRYGLLTDKLDITGPISINIVDDYGDEPEDPPKEIGSQ